MNGRLVPTLWFAFIRSHVHQFRQLRNGQIFSPSRKQTLAGKVSRKVKIDFSTKPFLYHLNQFSCIISINSEVAIHTHRRIYLRDLYPKVIAENFYQKFWNGTDHFVRHLIMRTISYPIMPYPTSGNHRPAAAPTPAVRGHGQRVLGV